MKLFYDVNQRRYITVIDSDHKGMNGRPFVGLLILVFICSLVFPILIVLPVCFCLPLWQRVFLNRNVIKIHIRRASYAALVGAMLILLYCVGMFLGRNSFANPDIPAILDRVLKLGTIYIGFGILTFGLGFFQILLSKIYDKKSRGNGYGLMNLLFVLLRFKPSRFWSWLQDVAVVLIVLAHSPSLTIAMLIVAVVLGYTWFCDRVYA
jgi:hypothetical protein